MFSIRITFSIKNFSIEEIPSSWGLYRKFRSDTNAAIETALIVDPNLKILNGESYFSFTIPIEPNHGSVEEKVMHKVFGSVDSRFYTLTVQLVE